MNHRGVSESHPEEGVPVVGQESVRLRLVLTVEGVQAELLLLHGTQHRKHDFIIAKHEHLTYNYLPRIFVEATTVMTLTKKDLPSCLQEVAALTSCFPYTKVSY